MLVPMAARHSSSVASSARHVSQPGKLHENAICHRHREAVAFFQPFFGATLKSNPSLRRAVLTGILRIAKENIFSTGVAAT